MLSQLIITAMSGLFGLLKPDMIKDFIDAGLDRIEDKHIQGDADTPREIAIRRSIDLIRSLLNIDDSKYGTDKK